MRKIGTKLGTGIGILLALCVIIGLVSYSQSRVVSGKVEEIIGLKEPMNSAVYELESTLVETGFALVAYLSTDDQKFLETVRVNAQKFEETQQKFFEVASSGKERDLGNKLNEQYASYQQTSAELIRLKELQGENMETLLRDLDAIDRLLTGHIRPSIKAGDPLAYQRLRAALEMEVNANAIMKGLGNFLLTDQPRYEQRVYNAEREFKQYFTAYRNVLISSQEARWAIDLRRLSNECIGLAKLIIDEEKQKTGKLIEFYGISHELRSILNDRILIRTEKNLADAKEDVLAAGKQANATILLMLAFGVAFGVIAGVATTRNITVPLQSLVGAMDAIARGDTSRRVELATSDELRSVGNAFNLMAGKLKRAHDDLRISEERFRLLVEGVKDYAIFMLDPDGNVASWNAGAERIKGYLANEIVGKPYAIFFPEEDVRNGKPEAELRKAAREGRAEGEGWKIRKDGSRFLAHTVLNAVRDDAGILLGFSKVTRDVTEQKQLEEELRESELRFRTIFEDAPIGIALTGSDGRYIDANPAAQEMLGHSVKELRDRYFADAGHPEAILADSTLFAETMAGKRTRFHAEITYKRSDGSTAWSNVNLSRMHREPDRTSYAIIMMEDITARKETEQQMRMLAHTIRSMNECVVITDATNTILMVNPAFVRTYGYHLGEIVGQNIEMLRSRAPHAKLSDKLIAAISAGGWTGELLNVRKNGEEFPIVLSTSVVRDDSGAAIALVGISRDITEQKRLQQQLAEAERQRSADLRRFAVSVQRAQEEERGRMSRELHDDLCQRLSGMKLRAEVLADEVNPINKKVFRQLRGFTGELDRTITEVRRISSNLRPSVLNDFGLTIALKLLCRDFENLHKIATSVHLDDFPPEYLDADLEIALYRIAQEALANVAKHSGASAAELHLLKENSSVRLVVGDDGKGFDEQDALRAKKSGHGLGLISIKERSELLGGSCEVASTRDKGTTITITIPLEERELHEENQDPHRG